MSDRDRVDQGDSAEDRLILDLMDELALASGAEIAERPDAAVCSTYIEALGLLPYGLDQLDAPERVRRQLLASVGPGGEDEISAFRGRSEAPPRPAHGRRLWQLPLAASLLMALFGYAAWQHRELSQQRDTIDSLAVSLEELDGGNAELASMREQLAASRERVMMATSRGAEICLLKPAGDRPLQPDAGGTLVVAAAKDRWYVRFHDLAPCTRGCAYQMWFITENGKVPGVKFELDSSRSDFQFTSTEMPRGMKAVSLTMENTGAMETSEGSHASESPTGQVLFADQAMVLL